MALLTPSFLSLTEMLAVAVREVPPNTQLTICYHEELQVLPRAQRLLRLSHSHHFVCSCERCAETGSQFTADKALDTTQPLLKKTELKRWEKEFEQLKAEGEAQRTTTGVTGAIVSWKEFRAKNEFRIGQFGVKHWLSFASRTALWRLLLTFWTAAVSLRERGGGGGGPV